MSQLRRFEHPENLEGLADDEYLWEPVDGCSSLRRAAEPRRPWGLAAVRSSWISSTPSPARYRSLRSPGASPTCSSAFSECATPRISAVPPSTTGRQTFRLMGRERSRSSTPPTPLLGCGRAVARGAVTAPRTGRGPFATSPFGSLVLRINQELIHHLAEVLLVRDLYRNRAGSAAPDGYKQSPADYSSEGSNTLGTMLPRRACFGSMARRCRARAACTRSDSRQSPSRTYVV